MGTVPLDTVMVERGGGWVEEGKIQAAGVLRMQKSLMVVWGKGQETWWQCSQALSEQCSYWVALTTCGTSLPPITS